MTASTFLRGFLSALLLLVFAGADARAEQPASGRVAFAVVVGNNRSLGNRRPDLHYADDDAVKYGTIFETLAPGRVTLLADLDDDTGRLFPDARDRAAPPTKSALLRVGRELADRFATEARAGREADLYFVFAGHGDVDEGTGFIELEDARFTSAELEAWLRAIPFARAHVVLDSCNSFFMLGSRRPGGHYYATSEDAARSLAVRLPNVGVFLSTSAEGESFEWSEIQSGIFSHVVRSGLMGAADANGDGAVSYVELAAFVATATTDVRNPNMRPHVFSRGPGGKDDEPIVPSGARTGVRSIRLGDASPLRVRLRDRDGLAVLDAHAEAGRTLALAVPARWSDGAVVERASSGDGGALLQTFTLPAGTTDLTLASLEPMAPRGAARGPADVFRSLFARPFGPRAFADYVARESAEPPQVFGVSREDAARMDLLLGQIESAEHGQRTLSGGAWLGVGALFGVVGGSILAYGPRLDGFTQSSATAWGGAYAGIGALSLAYGAYTLAVPWSGEDAAADYHAALRNGTDYPRAFAAAESRIREVARREAKRHWMLRGMGGALLLASVTGIAINEATASDPSSRLYGRAFGGSGVILGAGMVGASYLIESPLERLTKVWETDPGMLRLQPTAAPSIAPMQGGMTVGVAGRF